MKANAYIVKQFAVRPIPLRTRYAELHSVTVAEHYTLPEPMVSSVGSDERASKLYIQTFESYYLYAESTERILKVGDIVCL